MRRYNRPKVYKFFDTWIVQHRWGADECLDWNTAIDSANVYAELASGFPESM